MVDAVAYHERTSHSPRSVREDDFVLDRANRPRSFKRYRDLPREDLQRVRAPEQPALSVVAEPGADPLAGTGQPPPDGLDREAVATLCYWASGVVKTVDHGDGAMPFRAASCTGRLYHVDCYLVCGDLPWLAAGVYHFDPRSVGLDVVREGDHRGVLAAASDHPGVAAAPATVVATSTWWRNAWKYRERTYRHAFWDSGTVLANLLAAAHALDHRASVVAAFADRPVADLVGVDPEQEAPLELVALGGDDAAPAARDVAPIDPETVPYSDERVDYPLVHEAWAASTLADGDAAADWRERCREASVPRAGPGDGDRVACEPVDHATASGRPLHATVRRRGSCREYAEAGPSRRQLATVLDRATRGVPADWWPGDDADGLRFTDVYCLLTGVADVPDGTYQYHPGEDALERLGPTDRATKTHLALDQSWAGAAHANVYLLADVEGVVDALGDRGYRLAQLEAGVTLGRLYLATYAHRDLGGTGLTFYDGAVTEHLSPRAAGTAPTCLFAVGRRDG